MKNDAFPIAVNAEPSSASGSSSTEKPVANSAPSASRRELPNQVSRFQREHARIPLEACYKKKSYTQYILVKIIKKMASGVRTQKRLGSRPVLPAQPRAPQKVRERCQFSTLLCRGSARVLIPGGRKDSKTSKEERKEITDRPNIPAARGWSRNCKPARSPLATSGALRCPSP